MLLCCIAWSCTKWDLERIDFIEVSIDQPEILGLDSIRLSASYNGLITEQITKYGFIYQLTKDSLPIEFGNRIEIGAWKRDTFFDHTFNLDPFSEYVFVAFAEKGNDIVYSEEILYQTGKASVTTQSFKYTGGFNICLLYTSPSPRDRTRSRMPSSA